MNVMLVFGWMGSTCLNEWTMAVPKFAMGTAIILAGCRRFAIKCYKITELAERTLESAHDRARIDTQLAHVRKAHEAYPTQSPGEEKE